MARLDYPYVFQCENCGQRIRITESDVEQLPDDAGGIYGVIGVLSERGWESIRDGVVCPGCVGER